MKYNIDIANTLNEIIYRYNRELINKDGGGGYSYCHYTSLGSALIFLKNAIEKKGKRDGSNNELIFFASQIQYLNDSQEYKEGKKRLMVCQNKVGNNEKELCDSIFSASFCGEADLISQWRGYGRNGDDSGICFEFDFDNELNFKFEDKSDYFSLRPIEVCYDQKKDKDNYSLLKKVIMDIDDEQVSFNIKEESNKNKLLEMILVPLCKNESFRTEKESRLLIFPPERATILYRKSRSIIVPFVQFSVFYHDDSLHKKKLPIKRIVIGPGNNQLSIFSAIVDMLETNDIYYAQSHSHHFYTLEDAENAKEKSPDNVEVGELFKDNTFVENGSPHVSVKVSNGILVSLSNVPLRE